MSSEMKTKNLGLNQWQGNEYLKREDLVEDNKKIDDAMGEVNEKIKANADNITSIDNKRKSELKIINDFVFEKSKWTKELDYYSYVVYDNFVTDKTIVDVNVSFVYLKDLKLKSSTVSQNNYYKIFADELPSSNFPATIKMVKEVI